jgi:hypothetical protein
MHAFWLGIIKREMDQFADNVCTRAEPRCC